MPSGPDDLSLDAFRLRARRWLERNARRRSDSTAVRRYDEASIKGARQFQATQHAAGFAGITWPAEFGGQGLSAEHQMVFNEETEPFELPSSAFPLRISLSIVGPAILDHGDEDQKRRWLPEMLRGDALWVQLLSEPSAGSDLASLRMRAVPDGDEWVLTGEKVWSSFAQFCDYGIVLARTDWDAPKHAGLTMFAVPLRSPGLTVRPLREISGDEEFCQEFLDEVRVPAEAVIGGVNRGWTVTRSLFQHSRAMTSGDVSTGPAFDPARGGDPDPGRDLIDLATRNGTSGDSRVRRLVADAVTDNVVSGLLADRVARTGNPALAGMSKIFGSAVLQRKACIDLELRGEAAMAWLPEEPGGHRSVHDYMFSRTASVAGGTHEVILNTIAEQVLGLPREPGPDPNIPFRELPH